MNKKLNYWLAVSASLVMATSPAIFSSCSDDDDDDDPKKEQGSNEGENGGNGENNGGNNNNQGGGTDDPTQLPDPANAVESTTSGFNYVIINNEEVSISAITVGMKEMVIPAYVKINGKTYKVTDLEKKIFSNEGQGLDYLEKLTLPGTMSVIKEEFAEITGLDKCYNLKEVILGQGVTKIESHAFGYVHDIAITIPSSVQSVDVYAFSSGNILNIKTDDGVLYDESKTTLVLCGTNVKDKFTIPSSVKTVAGGAFENCADGLTVVIPSTLENYSIGSFYGANVEFATNPPIKDSGTKDGYGYVDLGLSVKWASCNVGAKTPEGYGDYFRWGEVTPYTENSAEYDNADLGSVLSASNDAATVNMGSAWRMPTAKEMDELMEKCNTAYAKHNGVNGVYCVSKVNSKAIFIPAAGDRYGSYLGNVGSDGYYWSSSLDESYSVYPYSLNFNSSSIIRYSLNYRYRGYSVRAVSE